MAENLLWLVSIAFVLGVPSSVPTSSAGDVAPLPAANYTRGPLVASV